MDAKDNRFYRTKENMPVFEAGKEIGRLEYQVGKLRGALKFVSTDPCFKHLGSVTQEEVLAALCGE